jgi:hypothetical protein
MRVRVTRDVPASENYSGRHVDEGEILHVYNGATYGCVSPFGVALCEVEGEPPFFEFPADAIEPA